MVPDCTPQPEQHCYNLDAAGTPSSAQARWHFQSPGTRCPSQAFPCRSSLNSALCPMRRNKRTAAAVVAGLEPFVNGSSLARHSRRLGGLVSGALRRWDIASQIQLLAVSYLRSIPRLSARFLKSPRVFPDSTQNLRVEDDLRNEAIVWHLKLGLPVCASQILKLKIMGLLLGTGNRNFRVSGSWEPHMLRNMAAASTHDSDLTIPFATCL